MVNFIYGHSKFYIIYGPSMVSFIYGPSMVSFIYGPSLFYIIYVSVDCILMSTIWSDSGPTAQNNKSTIQRKTQ